MGHTNKYSTVAHLKISVENERQKGPGEN